MKIAPILRQLRLGSDVAEEDEFLNRYFIRTSAFYDFIHDEADLILGPKGCGKSAIFKILRDGSYDIPDLADVDIIPAFNSQGSVFFQRILEENLGPVTEVALRKTWTAYVLSLVGNHLLDYYQGPSQLHILREALELSGLRAPEGRPRTAWDAVVARFLLRALPRAIEAGASVTDDGRPELKARLEFGNDVSGKQAPIEATEKAEDSWATPTLDLESILELEVEILNHLGRRCWVVFDRLDEAFQDSPTVERPALRGLLRAHSDICAYGSALRTKLFLRTDILDRITQEQGFVNITHLRSLRITWTEQMVRDMIVRRLLSNESFVHAFPGVAEQGASEGGRKSVLGRLLMHQVTLRPGQSELGLTWLLNRVTDGTKALNPRNVLTFLRTARDRQLAICDITDPDYNPNGALLSRQALDEAWPEVSRTRLWDTLYAEFQSLRKYVELLEYGPNTVTRHELAKLFRLAYDDATLEQVLKDLQYSGLLSRNGPETYKVADLYRPALSLKVPPGEPGGLKSANNRKSDKRFRAQQRERQRGTQTSTQDGPAKTHESPPSSRRRRRSHGRGGGGASGAGGPSPGAPS